VDDEEPLDDDPLPYGRLLSAAEAHRLLGIPASTVRTWHHRQRWTGLYSAGLDKNRRPLFYEADLLALKLRRQVRDKRGRRHHTMRDIGAIGSRHTTPAELT
jgi:hypothetical protein